MDYTLQRKKIFRKGCDFMKEVKELSPKIKKVVELLKLETDYINAYDMFDKYKNELEKVNISSIKSLSSSLSSVSIKELVDKTPKQYLNKSTNKISMIQHYKLKENN